MAPLLIVPPVGQPALPLVQAALAMLVLPVMPAADPEVELMPALDPVNRLAMCRLVPKAIRPVVPMPPMVLVLMAIRVSELLPILIAFVVGLQTRRVSPLEAKVSPLFMHRSQLVGLLQRSLLPLYMTEILRLRQCRPPIAKQP